MAIGSLLIIGGLALAAALSGKKKPKPKPNGNGGNGEVPKIPPYTPGDVWPVPPPPPYSGSTECEFDAHMPALIATGLRGLMVNPAATPEALRAVAATMGANGYPKAAACIEARAQQLEGGGGNSPPPMPMPPPSNGWPPTPPPGWPSVIPYPPPFPPPPGWPGGTSPPPIPPGPPTPPGPPAPPYEPIPGQPLGLSVTELQIQPGDTLSGYARWYAVQIVHALGGNVDAITWEKLNELKVNNPHLGPNWNQITAGSPLYVSNADYDAYGSPPGPTSQYQSLQP
jgi:hypothetical protein